MQSQVARQHRTWRRKILPLKCISKDVKNQVYNSCFRMQGQVSLPRGCHGHSINTAVSALHHGSGRQRHRWQAVVGRHLPRAVGPAAAKLRLAPQAAPGRLTATHPKTAAAGRARLVASEVAMLRPAEPCPRGGQRGPTGAIRGVAPSTAPWLLKATEAKAGAAGRPGVVAGALNRATGAGTRHRLRTAPAQAEPFLAPSAAPGLLPAAVALLGAAGRSRVGTVAVTRPARSRASRTGWGGGGGRG